MIVMAFSPDIMTIQQKNPCATWNILAHAHISVYRSGEPSCFFRCCAWMDYKYTGTIFFL